jgi:hypothetical protein
MTHVTLLQARTCMRRIAADKGVHVSIGEQHQVAEAREFVPGPSMTSRMLICMLSQHGDVLCIGAADSRCIDAMACALCQR